MTAGARSLFLLPKISESASHNQLKKAFHLKTEKPTNLLDHWKIFKEITNHPAFGEKWETELLFFSREWFETLNDKSWLTFKSYLLGYAWNNSEFWRNQYTWDAIFSLIAKRKNMKPNPYHVDIVKHLFALGVGAVPGFQPAIDNSVAPISRLQDIYLNDYKLKNYAPIIMQPGFFSLKKASSPVYYSLQHHTSIEFSPKPSNRNSAITDLGGVSYLLEKYLAEIKAGNLNISATPLSILAEHGKFDFFHNNISSYETIMEAANISMEDSRFDNSWRGKENKIFPKNSSFFNGCIRISSDIK
jgi:hypothetical protein